MTLDEIKALRERAKRSPNGILIMRGPRIIALLTLAEQGMRLREEALHGAASLAAAISLLERGGKAAKRAAPSDRMFDQMLDDYRRSLETLRAALAETKEPKA